MSPAPSPVDRASLEREAPVRVITREKETSTSESTPQDGAETNVQEAQSKGKVGRVTDQISGLSEDVREWAELRLELLQTEVTEQVEYKIGQIKQGGTVAVIGAVLLLFVLVTLALGLGILFGDPFWGFLAVTGLLALVALIAWIALKPIPPGKKK